MSSLNDEFYQGLLTDKTSLLDVPHHDTPERHEIGGALLAPSSVAAVGPGIAAAVGKSQAVARADHVHGSASDGSWTPYTPLLTANPVLGAGGISLGRYVQIGKLVFYQFRVLFGSSGTSPGSGTYGITVPVSANTSPWPSRTIGTARGYNPGTGQYFGPLNLTLSSATVVVIEYGAVWPIGALSYVTATVPWTWGVNMEFHGIATYEAA